MPVQVRHDTQISDIAVSLKCVSKQYQQRQRSGSAKDILRNLMHPEYRRIDALMELSMQINRSEIVAFAGPNGAGKSTTIKLLSGIIAPDAGDIRSLGVDPFKERVHYVGKIGVVFGQRTELWNDLPVAASFEWKKVVWDIPDERYRLVLKQVKELLDLDEFFQSPARELSLGQRMRADLALALLHEPELLLLDEPTLGLDVLAKKKILSFIKQLNRDRGITVMITSHDMSELEQLAGRIVLIDHGKLAFDGDFLQLRKSLTEKRIVFVETTENAPPDLPEAILIESIGNRHQFSYDSSKIALPELLEKISHQSEILDIETHRPAIDDVISEIYDRWRGTPLM